jgi:hypothetical protein
MSAGGCRRVEKPTLQVARLDRLSVVRVSTPGGVFEQFLDTLVERVVKVRRNVHVIELFFHSGFDD